MNVMNVMIGHGLPHQHINGIALPHQPAQLLLKGVFAKREVIPADVCQSLYECGHCKAVAITRRGRTTRAKAQ